GALKGDAVQKPDQDDPNAVVATGTFGTNVLVKINGSEKKETVNGKEIGTGKWDQDVELKAGETFEWSYSTDGGQTWITAKGTIPSDGNGGPGDNLRLPVPGGYVDFDLEQFNGTLPAGMQANIHPSRADLDYEIMKDTYLSVNSVGKDVFGGYYEGKPVSIGNNENNNLFEVVGAFIGYLEGNNQEGCQKTLAALENAEKTILAEATRIGGMENRLEMAADVLSFQKLDQQERLSYTEDIDLTELMTKLMRQQLTYQTVLQSSSMIMQLSLAKYV
ncbi:MAG: flagellar hook-associated protein 3, partial [Desulfovibrio sp.]|nr:flagellar hook-associated protein 3 [Desulfovibrio sp.]